MLLRIGVVVIPWLNFEWISNFAVNIPVWACWPIWLQADFRKRFIAEVIATNVFSLSLAIASIHSLSSCGAFLNYLSIVILPWSRLCTRSLELYRVTIGETHQMSSSFKLSLASCAGKTYKRVVGHVGGSAAQVENWVFCALHIGCLSSMWGVQDTPFDSYPRSSRIPCAGSCYRLVEGPVWTFSIDSKLADVADAVDQFTQHVFFLIWAVLVAWRTYWRVQNFLIQVVSLNLLNSAVELARHRILSNRVVFWWRHCMTFNLSQDVFFISSVRQHFYRLFRLFDWERVFVGLTLKRIGVALWVFTLVVVRG